MHNDKQNRSKGISPLAVGAAGLVAGVVGATAIAMKDDVIRDRAKKRLNEAKDTIKTKADEIKAKTMLAKDTFKDSANRVTNDLKDTLDDEDTV